MLLKNIPRGKFLAVDYHVLTLDEESQAELYPTTATEVSGL